MQGRECISQFIQTGSEYRLTLSLSHKVCHRNNVRLKTRWFYNKTLDVKSKRLSSPNLLIILLVTFLINHKFIPKFNECKNVCVPRSHCYHDCIVADSSKCFRYSSFRIEAVL